MKVNALARQTEILANLAVALSLLATWRLSPRRATASEPAILRRRFQRPSTSSGAASLAAPYNALYSRVFHLKTAEQLVRLRPFYRPHALQTMILDPLSFFQDSRHTKKHFFER